MRKSPEKPRRKVEDDDTTVAGSVERVLSHVPQPVRNLAAQIIGSPLVGLVAGFMLMFGGVFLAIAWQIGVQPLVDSAHYASFTEHVDAHIVESWAAIEFDPDDMPADRFNWQPYAKIERCVVADYSVVGKSMRRAFCGNHFVFREDFHLDDMDTLTPNVAVPMLRDARNFAVDQIRLSKPAFDWLSTHRPASTFMLSKPPPQTALAALIEQTDRPADVAVKSWTTPIEPFSLAFDPRNPEQAMPSHYAEERRGTPWLGGIFFAVVLALPGFYVWRLGMNFLFGGPAPLVLWLLTLAPVLALPVWNDALPRLLHHVDKNWASIATDMLDDLSRTTRLNATEPADAAQIGGERIDIRADKSRYAETFGRIPFRMPVSAPTTPEAARTALRNQVIAYVTTLDSAHRTELFTQLKQLSDGGLKNVQYLFAPAAELTLRDADSDAAAHAAAKKFLMFAADGTYYEDQLNAMEAAPRAARP